jgi:ABC-type nickel/cobalt efflux system permease component RcnA
VAYHEGFSVAAATAAPVIGLAHGLVAGRMIVRVVPAIGLVRTTREVWWLRTLRAAQLISPYLVAAVGFLLCWVAFQDSDGLPPLRV